jgi:hypothetical protein
MASALPLPGFFALAVLIDDVEDKLATAALTPIRDTLFLGPLLVIRSTGRSRTCFFLCRRRTVRVLRYLVSSRCGPWPRPPWCCWSRASPPGSTAARLEPAHALQSGMSAPSSTAHTNRLSRETSPYLLQHQHNPVDWWPWGPEALAEAQRTGRPILLSVGYAACHWCHVMAHESFEDEATARVMNELFVNIKVDREERPDIDQIYMNALHLLGEQGGWPLTMFLTPPASRCGAARIFPRGALRPRRLHRSCCASRAPVPRGAGAHRKNRDALMARLSEKARPAGKSRRRACRARRCGERHRARDRHAQWRPARRAEISAMRDLRTAVARRRTRPDGRETRRAPPRRPFFGRVLLTLEHISEGGIYDHLGGGFSRYSVDERWLVPHFEKDAVRQRAAPGAARGRACGDRRRALPRPRARDGRDGSRAR